MLFYHEWIVLYIQWFRWNYYDYFEIRLTIVDMIEPVHIQIELVNQFRMIEVFGIIKTELKSENLLSFNQYCIYIII